MTPLRDGEEMISKCTPHLIAGQRGSPRRSSNLQRILASLRVRVLGDMSIEEATVSNM
jgi:hypothetical protein